MDRPDVTLLGPRHRPVDDREAIRTWPSGPLAAVTSGAGLESAFGRPVIELELRWRWRSVLEADPELAAADAELRTALAERQALYVVRLRSALAAVVELARRSPGSRAQQESSNAAIESVRSLDRDHLVRMGELSQRHLEFIDHRVSVLGHRRTIADRLGETAGVVIGGGHVAELLQLCRVFDLAVMINSPVLAWSAGAMLLGTRVLLFHDHHVAGRQPAQFYAAGLDLVEAVVLPDASHRLDLHDREHARLIAARTAPQSAVLLDDREMLRVDHGRLTGDVRVLDRRGSVRTIGDDHGAA